MLTFTPTRFISLFDILPPFQTSVSAFVMSRSKSSSRQMLQKTSKNVPDPLCHASSLNLMYTYCHGSDCRPLSLKLVSSFTAWISTWHSAMAQRPDDWHDLTVRSGREFSSARTWSAAEPEVKMIERIEAVNSCQVLILHMPLHSQTC